MKKTIFISIFLVLLLGVLVWFAFLKQNQNNFSDINKNFLDDKSPITNDYSSNNLKDNNSTKNMEITSSAFFNNELIPSKYTCDGDNVNPPLEISNIPDKTKSLVLIIDDPDAPIRTWTHWIVWNISPITQTILENTIPQGAIQGLNSFKKLDYGGPCPPSGTHRYFFKVFALDTSLTLDDKSDARRLEKAMANHILAQAQLIGLYKRQ